ncbi:acyltransferase [Stackebrandtia soli]|uniref:acyltransferase n=1 Tax=Stackebrandtia soli TaxID=1892856 RepID=UPI0039E94D39
MSPRLWPDYLRFAWLRLRRPQVHCAGVVYLGRRVEVVARRGYGRLRIGADAHIGSGSAIRAHEGNIHIGAKCVLGARVTVNAYLDVHIGDATLIADDVYIIDFDHRIADLARPIMDQGIIKAPVRIGRDCWLGTKSVITRGVRIGDGAVVGAGAVVTRDVPPRAIVAGVPARVIGTRDDMTA